MSFSEKQSRKIMENTNKEATSIILANRDIMERQDILVVVNDCSECGYNLGKMDGEIERRKLFQLIGLLVTSFGIVNAILLAFLIVK